MLSMLKHQKWHFFFNFALWWRITIGFKPHKLFFPNKGRRAVPSQAGGSGEDVQHGQRFKCWGGVQMDPTWFGGQVGEGGEAGLASRDCPGCSSWICFWFSKVSLIMKMVIFREGWSLSALCIAISMLGRRKGSWPSTLSKLTGLLKKKWRNGLNTGLLTTLLLLSFLYD